MKQAGLTPSPSQVPSAPCGCPAGVQPTLPPLDSRLIAGRVVGSVFPLRSLRFCIRCNSLLSNNSVLQRW